MAAGLGEIHSLSRVVALVTGAASGLGKAAAARLARQARDLTCNSKLKILVTFLSEATYP